MVIQEQATSRRQAEFIDRLRRSRPSVEAVAVWLKRKGYTTIAPDNMEENPDWRPTEDYADAGDIWIIASTGDVRRLEVKKPELMFTCLENWPFLVRGEMFLTNAKRISQWTDEPLAHIIVNRALSHAAIVHERTRPYWFKRDVWMKNVGKPESTWIVDPVHAQFVRLRP